MMAFLTSFLHELTLWQGVTAAADILIVAYVIYRALILVKGTRGGQMLLAVGLVGIAYFLAKQIELTTLSWLLDNLINYSIIFFIVIFQHDIRRGLVRVGQNLFGGGHRYEETHVIEEVIKAAEAMASSRIGALIVLERDADLEEFFSEPGVLLDARVSKELIVTVFLPEPENTIHDGALVIRNLRAHRAGAVLPLSANSKLDKELGTRHRAAVGITEETDAVVVVVSEERGTVSLCFGGNIAKDLDAGTLRKALLGLFQKAKKAAPGRGGRTAAEPSPVPRAVEPSDGADRTDRIGEPAVPPAGRPQADAEAVVKPPGDSPP